MGQAEADRTKESRHLSADPVGHVSLVRQLPCRMFLGLCVSPVLANFWLFSGETTTFDCKNTDQIVDQIADKAMRYSEVHVQNPGFTVVHQHEQKTKGEDATRIH